MSATEIRETLTEVRDAVAVPPVDRLAFARRVRAERRRRTAGRVLVAGAAASVVAVGASLWAVQSRDPQVLSPSRPPSTRPPPPRSLWSRSVAGSASSTGRATEARRRASRSRRCSAARSTESRSCASPQRAVGWSWCR